MANPRPKCKFPAATDVEKVARKPVAVKLPPEIDEFVRSLPNRTEWLRRVIAEAAEKEMGNAS